MVRQIRDVAYREDGRVKILVNGELNALFPVRPDREQPFLIALQRLEVQRVYQPEVVWPFAFYIKLMSF